MSPPLFSNSFWSRVNNLPYCFFKYFEECSLVNWVIIWGCLKDVLTYRPLKAMSKLNSSFKKKKNKFEISLKMWKIATIFRSHLTSSQNKRTFKILYDANKVDIWSILFWAVHTVYFSAEIKQIWCRIRVFSTHKKTFWKKKSAP